MKNIRLLLLTVFCLLTTNALADPQLTSWLTNYSGQYARVYTTTNNRSSDNSVTTWSTNHTTVAYADIAQILYSSSYVYVRSPDLPSYRIGPWLNPQGGVGTMWPSNQHGLFRFPRSPTTPSTKTSTGTGYSGLLVNGLAIFNFADGKAWDGSAIVMGPHIQSTYYWHRSAPIAEDYNFDYTLGHQNPAGVFHVHQQPIALRYQLGDHVDFNSSTKNYSESTSTVTNHSPILGWAYDGYPIYGPYGYGVSNNASSGIRRMVSGYVLRNGSNGTDTLANNLSVIPAWYARYRLSHFGGTYSTTAGTSRPSVNSTYPLGTFAQDWSYYGDLTNSATGQPYVPGTNTFDLDVYGGRYCVTPEYPSGTYAYFVAIDSSNTPTYPYIFGFEYYGGAVGGSVSSITETVTTNFTGAADSKLTLSTPTVNTTNYAVTLVWSSTEGGTYQVESSTNQTTWTVEKSGIPAAVGVSTTTNYTSSVTGGTAYVRLTRTALATNDSVGGASGVIGQTNIQSFLLGNTAPTVANPISAQTTTYGSSFSFTFPVNTFSDADSGQTLTYTASSTVFTNTGISFNNATRTFSATTVDATNGGTIAGSYSIDLVATDNGSPAKSATNTFTLTINKATASVTPGSTSRNYGAPNPTFTGTLSGFVGADSITASYGSTATTASSAGTYSITATLTDPGTRLGNYNVTTNTGALTVFTVPLTVTANGASRNYGVTNPVFTGTITGLSNSDNITATFTTTATTNSAKGTYSITPVLSDPNSKLGNYTVTTNVGTFTVSAAPLTVTANGASRNYGVTNPVFTGTITGLTNADSITATFTTTATASSSVGNYSITPVLTDPGSKLGNYTVTTNAGTLTVSAALLTVTANNASRAYGSANPTFSGTITGLTNSDNITANYTSVATTNSTPGTYSITPIFTDPGSKLGNYSVTTNSGTLTVTQAVLLVTADAKSRTYGAANPTFTVSYSGFVNGQNSGTAGLTGSPALTTSADINSAVGSYTITSAIGTLSSANYSLTFTNGTLTVTAAPLTVTANSFSRAYGSDNPTLTGTISGLQNSDNITADYSTAATSASPVGSYGITVALNDPDVKLGNYSVTTNSGTLTVTNALDLGAGVYAASDTLYKLTSASNLVGSVHFGDSIDSMAFDASGNLYLFKAESTDIIKYTTDGNVSTFSSGLGGYGKLAFDNTGNLYAAIGNQNKILKFDSNGISSVFNSNVDRPYALAFDKYGRLYASTGTNSIVRLTSAGTSTVFVTNIISPAGLAFDSTGNLYVSSVDPLGSGSSILKFDTNGNSSVFTTNNLIIPNSLAFDQSGHLFLADVGSNTFVTEYSTDGSSVVYSSTNSSTSGGLAIWPLPSQLIPSSYSSLNEYATFTATNSLISLLTNGTVNYTFTNPDSGDSITVAVTATPLSTSNNSPVFKPLDFYGPNGTPVHASVDSGNNDGNWVDYYESARFTATLVSVTGNINTNTVEFGIAEMGIRNGSGALKWTSTTATNSFTPNADSLYALDSGRMMLAGTNYSGLLAFSASSGQMQFSDNTGISGSGLVFNVRFFDGTLTGASATLASSVYTNNQFQFAITGTASATYIVQATTNVSAGPWVSISTNTAPFSFTDTNTNPYQLRFYRVISGQ